MTDAALPTDYDALLTLYKSQESKLSHLHQFVEGLLEQIRLSRHQHFGSRSEKFNIDQLSLLAGEDIAPIIDGDKETVAPSPEEGVNDSMIVAAHCRTRGRRKSLPPELPRINIVHTL